MKLSGTGRLAVLLCASALAGCSTWQWHWPDWMNSTPAHGAAAESPAMPPDSAAGILYFVGGVLALPDAERAKAYHAAQQRYAANRTAADRLRLAALAALLPPPERDPETARRLLSDYSWRTTRPGYAGLVDLTLAVLEQQQRTRHRRTARVSQLRADLVAARKDNARLHKQLTALKAIEKNLSSRPPPGDER
ncbi:MAG TPA: hypothetical protein VFK45_07030 [Gammaproteobacteria bacterium]|nr:hypothetical protein [Gammaproteobacteria bacterium]